MLSRFARAFIAIITAMLLLAMLGFFHPPTRTYFDPTSGDIFGDGGVEGSLRQDVAKLNAGGAAGGGVIMPKLGNATAKAELGRATWKLLHTITLRFPENPTPDEQEALRSYFHIFSRLYPCGECATEFQQLLKKFPPQTSSRRSASLWLCDVHNTVNKRLRKPEFDCAHLDETYDCGCGDDPVTPTDPVKADARGEALVDDADDRGVVDLAGKGARIAKDDSRETPADPMDLERDPTKDDVTGAEMIRGGR
ncbi:ERV/ALR sulfhydryl oxidase domain-containing protein [Schizophyllum commune]